MTVIQANLNSVGKYIFLLFMLFLSTLNAFDAVIQLQVCILIHGFGGTIREKAENPKSKLDMIVPYFSRLNLQKSKCKIRVKLCIMDLFDMFF